MWAELFEALEPHLVEALMSLVALATGYATVLLRRWTGIQIEARHRDALHQAIRSAVVEALDNGLDGDRLLARVKDYVGASVPDALRHLAPGDGVLATLIRAKVGEALAAKLQPRDAAGR